MTELTVPITLGIQWTLVFLQVVFVALRLWANIKKGRGRLVTSDYVILVAVLLELPTTASITYADSLMLKYEAQAKSIGLPAVVVMSPPDLDGYLKTSVEHVVMYYVMAWMVKFAILTLYLDLMNRLTRLYKNLLGLTSVFTLVTFIIALTTTLTPCRPIKRMWTLDSDFCSVVQLKTVRIYFVCTMLADLAILAYTIALLLSLNLRRRVIWGVGIAVLAGIISVAASIVRFVLVLEILEQLDSTILVRQSTLLSQTEFFFGILASCLPSARLFARKKDQPSTFHISSGGAQSNQSWFSSAIAKMKASKNTKRSYEITEDSELQEFKGAAADFDGSVPPISKQASAAEYNMTGTVG